MHALVIYESLFGNTRRVAEQVAVGLRTRHIDAVVGSANNITLGEIESAGLLIVGAPTHAFGLSSPASRREAEGWSHDPLKHVTLEPEALDGGIREWLRTLPDGSTPFMAFDTRADHSPLLTGSAAKRIAKTLLSKGYREAGPIHSFLVDHNAVGAEQLEEARTWGEALALTVGARASAE